MTDMQVARTPWSAKIFVGVAALAAISVAAVPLFYRHYLGSDVSHQSSEWNNFGTFVGGVLGPVLSMLAFFALIYTIFLQEQQLSLARATLKAADEDKELTRKQLEAAIETQRQTSDALTQQNRATSATSSHAIFLETLKLHHSIIESLTYKNWTGRAVIHEFIRDLGEAYRNTRGGCNPLEFDKGFCTQAFSVGEVDLSHYFRNLFQALVFLTGQQYADKEAMIQFLIAQLSDVERVLLFYYGLSSQGSAFKYRIEQDGLMRGLDQQLLFASISTMAYNPLAWGQIRVPYRPPEHWH